MHWSIEWTAKLPRVFARTGYHRDYYLVGQWFPKIAVYEPAGTRGRTTGGWNCHQFHADSEFYADFGRFRVNITAPRRFIVGATGGRTGVRANADGTTTHTYEQDDVHDFAWTADPNYVEVLARFSATADVTPGEYAATAALLGRSLDEVRLSDVEIRVLMQPGRRPQVDRYVAAAKLGIKNFGLWYGRYPYRTLTIVDPAPGAEGSAGMEYPTLITAGSSAAAQLLAVQPAARPRAGDGARVRAPVLVRAGRRTTSSRRRGWTRDSPPTRAAGSWTRLRPQTSIADVPRAARRRRRSRSVCRTRRGAPSTASASRPGRTVPAHTASTST